MTNKDKYRELCKQESKMPIFSKDWWIDAVVGEGNWDVVIVEKDNQIIASLPYYKNKKTIFDIITMPKLTQTMGIWIKYPQNQKYSNKLSYEKEIFLKLIQKLPHFDYFNQNFHYSFTNWLPFYWKGFKQTTKYTYVIDNLTDIDIVYNNMKSNTRGKIRKASKLVDITTLRSIEDFYKVNMMTYERQNIKIPYSLDFIRKKDSILKEKNAREIFFAIDKNGNIHSALYLIWDDKSSYVHMVGENPNLRNSGAGILLIWEAIKYTKNILKLNIFDFEGSMLESIESVRRAFGAKQKPYFSITKINSNLLKIVLGLRK